VRVETLRDIRINRLKKTLGEIERETGIARSLLSRYERGEVLPNLPNLRKLQRVYPGSVDEIMAAIERARSLNREGA